MACPRLRSAFVPAASAPHARLATRTLTANDKYVLTTPPPIADQPWKRPTTGLKSNLLDADANPGATSMGRDKEKQEKR